MPLPRRGVTLVEVLLAAAVLAVVMIPMVGMFQLGNRMGVAGDRELRATFLAHELLERLRWELDRSTARSTFEVSVPSTRARPVEGFTHEVERDEVEPGLVRVVVTVRWKEGRVERSMQLATLVSRTPNLRVLRRPGAPTGGPGLRRRDLRRLLPGVF